MKKYLFPVILLLLGVKASGQQDFFALTGKDTPSIIFNDFRALDVINGTSGETMLTADSMAKVFSQSRNGSVIEDKNSYNHAQSATMAALAYDPSGNNLIYMPMFSSNVYVLNNKTKEITLVENNVTRVTACDINSHITRMATGYDGNVYAINNAGTQFLQITRTGNQYSVHDLGIIKDDISNGKNSFTTIETGFGGDMIADADGNFYVFSTSGNIFKILKKELKARFVGKITGLPENYSVNGSAVNSKGKVVIASAKGAPLYEVDMQTLTADKIPGDLNLHIYDLASKYFVNDKSVSSNILTHVDIYPTKVNEHFITIDMNDQKIKENIILNVFDMSGKNVMKQNISAKGGTLNQKVFLNNLVDGAYIVNLTEDSGKILLNKKIIVTK